jgi:hypothetical protein
MLIRRAILGAVALVLAILVAQLGRVSTSAEDQAEVPANSESQAEPGAKADADGYGEPTRDSEETIEIPLSEIVGGSSLRGLEPELFIERNTPEKRAEYSTPEKLQEIRDKAESSLAYQIEQAMNKDLLDTDPDIKVKTPAPGFAVVGRDRAALAGIHKVVVEGKEPQHSFSSDDDISLVFFTLTTNAGVRLIRVERFGSKINIQYVLIITGTLGMFPRLYIIPVGQLPGGEYEVNLLRALKEEPKYARRGYPAYEEGVEEGFVCKPFHFVVLEKDSGGKGEE